MLDIVRMGMKPLIEDMLLSVVAITGSSTSVMNGILRGIEWRRRPARQELSRDDHYAPQAWFTCDDTYSKAAEAAFLK